MPHLPAFTLVLLLAACAGSDDSEPSFQAPATSSTSSTTPLPEIELDGAWHGLCDAPASDYFEYVHLEFDQDLVDDSGEVTATGTVAWSRLDANATAPEFDPPFVTNGTGTWDGRDLGLELLVDSVDYPVTIQVDVALTAEGTLEGRANWGGFYEIPDCTFEPVSGR